MSDTDKNIVIPDDLTLQIAALLKNGLGAQPTTTNSENLSIGIKLSGDNYSLWATLMKKAIGGRGRGSHLTGEPSLPSKTDQAYVRWEQDDQCVFTWLIQNIESSLVNNVSQYPTAKALWDGLAVTYGSGTDSLQIFDLHKKANSLRQGKDTLEECWNKLQNIWMTIDRRDPNPMKETGDIQIYNKKIQEQRLYQLLIAIDDKLEPIKRDILKRDPLPSVETAYAAIRREIARLNILQTTSSSESSEIGLGLVAREPAGRNKFRSESQKREKEDKSKLYCTNCNMKKHTKDTCFRLVGYPDWWEKPGQRGKAAAAVGGQNAGDKSASPTSSSAAVGGLDAGDKPAMSSAGLGGAAVGMEYVKETGKGFGSYTPNPAIINPKYFKPCCFDVTTMNETPKGYQARSPIPRKMTDWIFDCGATDTMTYDPNDFLNLGSSSKTYIETASGEHVEVKGGGAIEFSRNMKLKNCLYIPTLSSKLLSVSQVTKELNCGVLMYPTFCILQDILTREIIGRGTERGGLYYVDEVTHQGHAMLAHGTADRQLWLWHRRLGHPSFGYLKMLFPSLFLNKSTCMKCETCVLAKNHRVSFNPSNTRVNSVFSLVHSDVWGPAPNSKKNRFKCFVLFVDDFSRMTWVYFMKHKSEVPEKFFVFYKMIQTQFIKKNTDSSLRQWWRICKSDHAKLFPGKWAHSSNFMF